MSFAVPIQPTQTVSGNQFNANRIIEEASQTFLAGTPVELDSSDGGLKAWDGTTLTNIIAGISYEGASNLASTGLGAPTPFNGISGAGSTVTFGSVPNEASAVNIPHGSPLNDGRCGLWTGTGDTVFTAAFGNNGSADTPTAADVGVAYGLTKESATGYWYVDKNKTSTSAAVRIMALDPRYTPAAGSNVLFTFLPGVVSLVAS
jgi:hypothetical protein